MQSVKGEPLVSLQEVAEYLGVPAGTIYGWRYRREGPKGFKVGQAVRYRWSDVERWLREQADQQPTA